MNLNDYFENTDGMGILATADSKGNVDCAVYAAPHVLDEETVGFIMRPRLSFHNIQQNPKAVYMYVEKSPGYQGKRLYLEKTQVESDPVKIGRVHHKSHGDDDEADAVLIYFKVMSVRPLVGDGVEK